jgi:hypothetical protein
MIKDSLKNPKAADLNKDGKLSDYEEKRGATIEKSITKEGIVNENKQEAAEELQMIMDQLYELSDQAKMIFRNNFPGEYRRLDAYGALDFGTSSNRFDVTLEGTLENLDMEDDDEGMMQEDLDLGHQDNEPHMLKADLYRIGKYAMDLYQMMDEFEGKGEVDFPHWWQSKIINAKSNLVGAKHYLDFEAKEPAIDAMVGVASDEEILDDEAPMMESAYDYVKTPKEYVALQLSDFFRVPKDKLMSFNLDGTDNIDALTKALNSTSNQGTEMYLKMSMKSAQEHFDSSMMNEDEVTKAEKIAKRLAEKLKNN